MMKLPGRSVSTSKSPDDAAHPGTQEIEFVPEIGMSVVVDIGDGVPARGVIVDDFGDLAGIPVGIGTEHVAQARRWAVDVDGGHIVFVDDEGLLELNPQTPTP